MPLIDFILNLAGLLLWLNWLAISFDPLARATAATLAGTLKKADTSAPRRWKLLATLLALLLFRAYIYYLVGSAVGWTPHLHLGFIDLAFLNLFSHPDSFYRMLLYSGLSFGTTLATFYFWLLLLSTANVTVPDNDPIQKTIRLHIRWIERWPRTLKLLLPFIISSLLWLIFHPLFVRLAIVPTAKSAAQLIGQAIWIGIGSYLSWKFLLVGILLLHILNSYVYLGNHPFWNFINATAHNLLTPISWIPLRMARVDFAPLVGIALVFLISEFLSRLPTIEWLHIHKFLPF
jgi:uncharacterized protein YggT (Ycf19 family)